MTRELIIEGQHVDLAPDTDITLEYVSNLIGDVGKISLSHSYTVKLPKTTRNARILDDPGNPSYVSAKARRYLSAEYYRNGINLIGQARAYILDVTDDSYEVALVWSSIPGLSEWSSAKPKLPDLKGLPTLTWKDAPLADRNTTDGCFYAQYTSGARPRTTESAPHPSVTLYELTTRIFNNAGIPYRIGSRLADILKSHALLVAPSHKPSLEMELEAGARADELNYISRTGYGSFWWFQYWHTGWDAPEAPPYNGLEVNRIILRGPSKEMRFFLNLRLYDVAPDLYLELKSGTSSYILQPTRTEDGGYLLDAVVDLESELDLGETDELTIAVQGLTPNGYYQYKRYDDARPLFALMRPHDTIPANHQNLFPVAENLPDIGQLDFIKGVLGLFGGVAIPGSNRLTLEHYDELLSSMNAVDWTGKMEMGAGLTKYSSQLQDFAQNNIIKYEEDVTLPVSPDINLIMQDETASLSKDRIKLPFAASRGSEAIHYKYDHDTGEIEDVDIKPRVFGFTYDENGTRKLSFLEDMAGDQARWKYHGAFQSLIRKPVQISINVRLHELDLAQLDLTRPVYLGQYGKYYAILKIQTSETDLCKVELLQLI